MGDVVKLPDPDGVKYVNENVLPVVDVPANFLLQVFVSACLNGAAWWLEKVGGTDVTKMSEDKTLFCLDQASNHIDMCLGVLHLLPRGGEGPNSRTEVVQEIAGYMLHLDELLDLAKRLAPSEED